MTKVDKQELEKRECKCGCKRVFWCNPKAKQAYFSFYECDPVGKKKLENYQKFEFGSK